MVVPPEVTDLDIKNVYIYVADAVRWDSVPNLVSSRGISLKTVAASIHSPTSFASLVTGRYLASHGVADFKCKLPKSLFNLFDISPHRTKFVNSIGVSGREDPIYSVLNQPASSPSRPFDSIVEPFVIMERGQGGHAPYGNFNGTAPGYFESRKRASIDQIQKEYQDGVEQDGLDFINRLNELESKGVLEDTLIIYTSDHGELLGEGGMFGHNGPIRPELVYVPTVFIHPSIQQGTTDNLFAHTELLPAILNILGITEQSSFDPPTLGIKKELAFCFYKSHYDLPLLRTAGHSRYDSVWTMNGGHVIPRTSRLKRAPSLFTDLFTSPPSHFARREWYDNVKSHMKGHREFGDPPGEVYHYIQTIDEWEHSIKSHKNRTSLSESLESQLEDLGYMQ